MRYYGTIFAFAESPLKPGLFWAGSDDGLIHVSQDDGETWQNVTPKELPEWALISIIEPSLHDPATAYVAATRYKLDDFQPYLFKTHDYGQTWTKIVEGIDEVEFTRVVREDPVRRGLLYAGTETSIYVSFDDGEHWQSLQSNLPVVPIHDLVIKDSDLVVATHGRSFWILDDVTALRQFTEAMQSDLAYLFAPRPTIRFKTVGGFSQVSPGLFYQKTGVATITARRKQKPNGETVDENLNAGQNPPNGVIVTYYLKQKPEDEVKLTFRQDTLNHPAKLNVKLTALTAVVASADAAPTSQAYELFEDLSARIQEQQQRLQNLIDTDVKAFNTLIRESGVPAILPGMTSSING